MQRGNLVQLIATVLLSIFVAILFIYFLLLIYDYNRDLGRTLSNALAGILTGLLFAILNFPMVQKGNWRIRITYRRLHNIPSLIYIIVGASVFFMAGTLGTGIVYGIDFAGITSQENNVAKMFIGEHIYGITFAGAFWGLYVGGGGFWMDIGILRGDSIGYGLALFTIVISVFFGIALTRLLATPFIAFSVLSRAVSSIIVYKFLDHEVPTSPNAGLIAFCLIVLPFMAYLSGYAI